MVIASYSGIREKAEAISKILSSAGYKTEVSRHRKLEDRGEVLEDVEFKVSNKGYGDDLFDYLNEENAYDRPILVWHVSYPETWKTPNKHRPYEGPSSGTVTNPSGLQGGYDRRVITVDNDDIRTVAKAIMEFFQERPFYKPGQDP